MPFTPPASRPRRPASESFRSLVEGGADLVEIGVPFSDPLADGTDGPAHQPGRPRQRHAAGDCIELVRELRADGITAPLLLMGYYNPILRYGHRALRRRLRRGRGGRLHRPRPARPKRATNCAGLPRARPRPDLPGRADHHRCPARRRRPQSAAASSTASRVTGVTGAREQHRRPRSALHRPRPPPHRPARWRSASASRRRSTSRQVGEVADGAIVGARADQRPEHGAGRRETGPGGGVREVPAGGMTPAMHGLLS